MLLPTCPVGGNLSAQRHLDEAGSVPAALSLRLVVAIGPRGIPFLALPSREQHNADRSKGEDQPERRDRARPVTIALVKAEQLDEHQDHFVVDTTIIKVRSVNEATDRTVSLPVVPVVNQIRTYWWCSPPRIGRQRMCPVRSTARETGVSFSKDRCVRTSCTTAVCDGDAAHRTQQH